MRKVFSRSELRRPVIVVCNGPSSRNYTLRDFPENALIFRMNHFYKEEHKNYGDVVDGFFAAVDHKLLYDNISDAVTEKRYQIRRYFNPLSLDHRAFADRKQKYGESLGEFIDHWAVINRCPESARLMTLRPLPTQGIQTLAAALEWGFKEIYVVGMDLYSDPNVRYSWTYSEKEISSLGKKHATPGYENGAHTLDADLLFLDALLSEYVDADVKFLSSNPEVSRRSRVSGTGRIQRKIAVARRKYTWAFERYRAALQHRVATRPHYQRAARIANILIRRKYDVGFILNENIGKVGSPKPIHNYAKHNCDRRRVKVYQIAGMNSPLKIFVMRMECKKIVVNGLKTFESKNVFLLKKHAGDLFVYLHETRYVFERWKSEFPEYWDMTREFLSGSNLLCVSQLQKDYLERELKVGSGKVIYNSIIPYSDPIYSFAEQCRSRNIIMVGTRQTRKGVELFSRTADLAKSRGGAYRFIWVGGKDVKEDLYFSDNVTWIPNQDDRILDALLSGAHVFFLSSIDDPFPLVCLEAIAKGLRLVVYKGTGSAELSASLDTLEVYDEYTPEGALRAIDSVAAKACVRKQYEYINNEISSVESFSRRLEASIGI